MEDKEVRVLRIKPSMLDNLLKRKEEDVVSLGVIQKHKKKNRYLGLFLDLKLISLPFIILIILTFGLKEEDQNVPHLFLLLLLLFLTFTSAHGFVTFTLHSLLGLVYLIPLMALLSHVVNLVGVCMFLFLFFFYYLSICFSA